MSLYQNEFWQGNKIIWHFSCHAWLFSSSKFFFMLLQLKIWTFEFRNRLLLNWQFGLFMRLFRAYFCPLCMYNMVMCYVHFLTLELLRLLNSGKEVIKTMLQPPAFLVNKAKQQHNQTLGYLTYSAYFPLVFFHKDILWRFSM